MNRYLRRIYPENNKVRVDYKDSTYNSDIRIRRFFLTAERGEEIKLYDIWDRMTAIYVARGKHVSLESLDWQDINLIGEVVKEGTRPYLMELYQPALSILRPIVQAPKHRQRTL